MSERERSVRVGARAWADAGRALREAAGPAQRRSRLAAGASLVVLGVPAALLAEGRVRLAAVLYVAVAAVLVGAAVRAWDLRRRRERALDEVRPVLVPALVDRASAEDLALLVVTRGVWIGPVLLLAEDDEARGEVVVRRPADPSVHDHPGFVLGIHPSAPGPG